LLGVSDLIPVRDDEGFDVERYQTWARTQGDIPGGIPTVTQFSKGKANLTYLVTYSDGTELVLRRPPLGPIAASSHDMSREYRVLSRLWKSYPLAPRAIAFCDDQSVIGTTFFVMERRSGIVVKNKVPELFGGGRDVSANRALSEVVIDTLADLHAVDPVECGLDGLGHPDGFLERQVTGWTERWERSKNEPNAIADEVGVWLGRNLPVSGRPTLIHNDWRLDNMAVSPDDPGQAVAVYDWDMATRGDPLADLGTLLATWYEPGEAPSTLNPMPTDAEGWIRRAEAITRYAGRTGRKLEDIEWYVTFGTWKLAVVLQQIYIRWVRGQTQDDRFQALGGGATRLFELAAERRS
jgi:aminoglycoside phosphotransferase (APT) family kinase protein